MKAIRIPDNTGKPSGSVLYTAQDNVRAVAYEDNSLRMSSSLESLLNPFFILVLALLLALWQNPASAGILDLTEREQAKRIHDRLTGVLPSKVMLDEMESVIVADAGGTGLFDAAIVAIDGNGSVTATPFFYNVTVKNWASPWTNEADDVFVPLNDYSALVIGLVRDGDSVPFTELLSGNLIYVGANSLGLPAYSATNNNHYEQLELAGANFGDSDDLVQRSQTDVTGLPAAAVSGIFSTRAAARAFFVDGTNRAMTRFTLKNHLCNDMEQLKDVERPADRIRQDVSRSPGGDSRIFLTSCVGCHSGMDPLTQAFAYYNFEYPEDDKDGGQLVYTAGTVQEKFFINEGNFNDGYVTPNDGWTNRWRIGANVEKLGWLSSLSPGQLYVSGSGAASMGRELASSQAFAYCQVKKAFKSMCLREPTEADRAQIDTTAGNFMSGGYNMKHVFAELAVSCSDIVL